MPQTLDGGGGSGYEGSGLTWQDRLAKVLQELRTEQDISGWTAYVGQDIERALMNRPGQSKPPSEDDLRRFSELIQIHGLDGVGGILADIYAYNAGSLPQERRNELDTQFADPKSDTSLMRKVAEEFLATYEHNSTNPEQFVDALIRTSLAQGPQGIEPDPASPPVRTPRRRPKSKPPGS